VDDSPRPLSGVRVLVVDDDEDTRFLLELVVGHAGARVITASSAHDAIEAVPDADVVVTDYSMPGNTGLWLLERVQERTPAIPVIMVTGYADSLGKQITQAPFARVLRKPIDPWQVCDTIADVVRTA
jgi:CheY-like chemotaxis protein